MERLQLLLFCFKRDLEDDESESTTFAALFPHNRHCWCSGTSPCLIFLA